MRKGIIPKICLSEVIPFNQFRNAQLFLILDMSFAISVRSLTYVFVKCSVKRLQKGLIEEAGRLDLPGRPVSFRTTDVFLRTFGIASLAELPPLHGDDYAEMEEEVYKRQEYKFGRKKK